MPSSIYRLRKSNKCNQFSKFHHSSLKDETKQKKKEKGVGIKMLEKQIKKAFSPIPN